MLYTYYHIITVLAFSSMTSFNLKKNIYTECHYVQWKITSFVSQVTISVCEQNVRARHSGRTAAKVGRG